MKLLRTPETVRWQVADTDCKKGPGRLPPEPSNALLSNELEDLLSG
jgi:hypothetical protein